MPRASKLLAGLLCICLAGPGFAQEGNNQPEKNTNQQQSTENRTQQNQNQTQEKQKKNPQLVEASLDQGQSLKIPAGAELLELTVAVPETINAGQRYRYRARITNTSDSTTLANVRLVQINGNQIDVEQAQFVGNQPSQNSQAQQQQRNQQQQQRNQNQQQQKQQQQAQQQQQQNQQQQQANQQAQNQRRQQAAQQAESSTQGPNRSWTLGQLKPGESRELAVTAIASETGTLEHCFAVRYEEVLCAPVEVVKPTITITKAGPEQASVCEVFEYRYTLENTGTGVAKNFVVRDELPEGLVTESGKSMVEFRVPELAEGQSETYAAKVHSMKAGEFASRAIVEQDSGETRQSKQVATQVVAPKLDLQIEGPRAIKAGEGGNFDVTVTNTSEVPARNVILTLNPGENAEITNAGKGDARQGGKSYRYDLGNMKPNDPQRISVTLDSTKQDNVTLNATAQSLCALNQEKEVAVAEAEADLQARVLRITGLLLSVVDTDDVIPMGKTVTYRIRVRNQGSFPDKDVKVNLALPEGLTFQEAKGPTEGQANGQGVSLGTVEEIRPGETLEWLVTTKAESAGEKIVESTLDSHALQGTVEAQEVSTIYDASKQKAQGKATASEEPETRRE